MSDLFKDNVFFDKNTGTIFSKEEALELMKEKNKDNKYDIHAVSKKDLSIKDGLVEKLASSTPVADRLNMDKENLAETKENTEVILPELTFPEEVIDNTITPVLTPNDIFEEQKAYEDIQRVFEKRKPLSTISSRENIIEENKNVPFYTKIKEKLINSSVAKSILDNKVFARDGKRKGVKYNNFVNLIKNLSLAVALTLSVAKGIDVTIDVVKNMEYHKAYQNICSELQEDAILVNDHKIAIEDTLDQHGFPVYWIDTEGVAKDVLNIPDQEFLGALYMAYDQMGNDRVQGDYHNWDHTIRDISENAGMENPTAFATTQDCRNFEDFLIKNGYVNKKTQEPDIKAFEEAGRQAVIDFNKDLMNNEITMGGARS